MKTDDHVLTEAYSYQAGALDALVLPQGAFVRPISARFIPKHILNSDRFKWVNFDMYQLCYTRFGMMPIPKRIIRKV